LRLDENRILVEQLKLLLGNVGRTAISVILLTILILWMLSNDSNALALNIRGGIVCMAVMLSAFDGLM
jgi:hypothetical protein